MNLRYLSQVHFDPKSKSLQVIDVDHYMIHKGVSFYFNEVITLNSGASVDYLIETPEDENHLMHFGYDITAIGVLTLEFFEDVNHTGTTSQVIYNRNRAVSTLSQAAIYKGITAGNDAGDRILHKKEGYSSGNVRVNAEAGDAHERVLDGNKKYHLKLTSGTASNDITVMLNWYELDVRFDTGF